jgi:hypothetical protein
MTRERKIFWTGLSIYAASFFLVSFLHEGDSYGFYVAFVSLVGPWIAPVGYGGFHSWIEWAAVLVCGWINLVFLVEVVRVLTRRHRSGVSALRVMVILMIPFCWIAFYYDQLLPREGHIAWILGMMVTLFSIEIAAIGTSRASG